MILYLSTVVILLLCVLHLIFTFNGKNRLIRKVPGPKEHFLVGNAISLISISTPVNKFGCGDVWNMGGGGFVRDLGRRMVENGKDVRSGSYLVQRISLAIQRGNAAGVMGSFVLVELFNFGRLLAATYNNGIYKWWSCLFRTINIYNPEDIEIIISSSKHNEKSIAYKFLKPWLREGLLLSKGSKWLQRRKILTPAFHFNILRKFCVTLEENSHRFVENLAQTRGECVDIVPVLSDYTLNNICETAMGTSLHAETNNFAKSYQNAIGELGKLITTRYCQVYYVIDVLFNLSSLARKQKEHLNTVHSFTGSIIRKRKDFVNKHGMEINNIVEKSDDNCVFLTSRKNKIAMLDLLISAEEKGDIDCTGIQEEVDTFLFEGHDTTASGLIFCLMLLANHKDVQEKIVSELREIFDDSSRMATMEDLSMMKYLECCIKESMRLYPPVPFIGRRLSETVTLSNYTIPEGTYCNIHVYDLHRRENLYKNALIFDPDRFLPENCVGRHPYAYIPFSAGPRNCIGQRFAMMELKSCLAAILMRFELHPVTRPEDLLLMADLVLRNSKPVYVKFVERVSKKTII